MPGPATKRYFRFKNYVVLGPKSELPRKTVSNYKELHYPTCIPTLILTLISPDSYKESEKIQKIFQKLFPVLPGESNFCKNIPFSLQKQIFLQFPYFQALG